jgi:hypothetical protein
MILFTRKFPAEAGHPEREIVRPAISWTNFHELKLLGNLRCGDFRLRVFGRT